MNKELGIIGNHAKLNKKTDSMLYSSHVFEPFRDNNAGNAAGSVDSANKYG
jgi:hypothetical protein